MEHLQLQTAMGSTKLGRYTPEPSGCDMDRALAAWSSERPKCSLTCQAEGSRSHGRCNPRRPLGDLHGGVEVEFLPYLMFRDARIHDRHWPVWCVVGWGAEWLRHGGAPASIASTFSHELNEHDQRRKREEQPSQRQTRRRELLVAPAAVPGSRSRPHPHGVAELTLYLQLLQVAKYAVDC